MFFRIHSTLFLVHLLVRLYISTLHTPTIRTSVPTDPTAPRYLSYFLSLSRSFLTHPRSVIFDLTCWSLLNSDLFVSKHWSKLMLMSKANHWEKRMVTENGRTQKMNKRKRWGKNLSGWEQRKSNRACVMSWLVLKCSKLIGYPFYADPDNISQTKLLAGGQSDEWKSLETIVRIKKSVDEAVNLMKKTIEHWRRTSQVRCQNSPSFSWLNSISDLSTTQL